MKIKNVIVVFSTIISLMGDDLPNGHAPISVMADHFHKKGEIMFSYRFMNMGMSKDFQGYEETMKVKAMGYKYYGTKMDMQMHMLGAMYGFTDKITIMTMINMVSTKMNMTEGYNTFGDMIHDNMNHEVSGIGDLSVTAMYALRNSESMKMHLNVGASLPTGSLEENHKMNMDGHHHKMKSAMKMRNGYAMQLGSGTIDPIVSFTVSKYMNNLAVGIQNGARLRLADNKNGYRLGNEYYALGWAGYNLSNSLSIGSVIRYKNSESISGYDKEIMKNMGPSSDPNNSGRSQVEISVGANYLLPESLIHGARIAVEYAVPVSSDYTGIQMKIDNQLTIGLQYSIK
jgi:hypothetical protein